MCQVQSEALPLDLLNESLQQHTTLSTILVPIFQVGNLRG